MIKIIAKDRESNKSFNLAKGVTPVTALEALVKAINDGDIARLDLDIVEVFVIEVPK